MRIPFGTGSFPRPKVWTLKVKPSDGQANGMPYDPLAGEVD